MTDGMNPRITGRHRKATGEWLRRVSGAALVLGAVAVFLSPLRAGAVSSADAEYVAVLRLTPHMDHGAKLFKLCAACHGRDGRGSSDGTVPAIAGQFMPVLVEQLIQFRYGRRHSIRAEGFIANHRPSVQDIADVAAYVSSLPPREPTAGEQTPQRAHGAAVFQSLCASCHGSRGEGDPSARVPRLAGQHSEYIIEQLREVGEGGRPNLERDHAHLLVRLSMSDVNAIAAYVAQVSPGAVDPTRLAEPNFR